MFNTCLRDVLIHFAGKESVESRYIDNHTMCISIPTTRLVIVSQYTSVGIFSFPKILHTIHPFLSLNHKSVCFTLPLLNKDRVQFKLNAIDFLSLPASESKYVIVERTAAVSADIEGLAVFLYFLHDFLGT